MFLNRKNPSPCPEINENNCRKMLRHDVNTLVSIELIKKTTDKVLMAEGARINIKTKAYTLQIVHTVEHITWHVTHVLLSF